MYQYAVNVNSSDWLIVRTELYYISRIGVAKLASNFASCKHDFTSDNFIGFLPSATKLCEVIFLHLSVCPQGGSASVHAGIPPPRQQVTPPPGAGTPLPPEQTPWEQAPPPPSRHPRPRDQQTATVAVATHPNGMHSC